MTASLSDLRTPEKKTPMPGSPPTSRKIKTPERYWWAASVMLLACASNGDGSTAPTVLQNENNYRATGRLSLPTVQTASGKDVDICWTDMTTDIQCHQVAPLVDIDNVALLRLSLREDQVEQKLTAGTLAQSEVSGYLESRADHVSTCTKLFNFSFRGTSVKISDEYQERPGETFMLLFTRGIKTALGARMMMFIAPTAASDNTKVAAPPGCGLLDFQIDLSSLRKVPVPVKGPWMVDWRNLTADGLGNAVLYTDPDQLFVGFYQDKTVVDLEAAPFQIESLATALWDLPLTGEPTADLAKATLRSSGGAFDGFAHGTGTWILALMCSTCQNPAPILLTVLEPQGGQ